MQANKRRAAADARRAAADQHGERGGQTAYRAYRSVAPGVGVSRMVGMATELRAVPEKRNGKDLIHTSGFFTTYNRPYPMWDQFGEYEEIVNSGAGTATLAAEPDVAFLVNHKGVTMARTRAGTLVLGERAAGGWHDAYLNPERTDVRDLVTAIDDGNINEMSFAFMIPDGMGWWSDDFTTFQIRGYDINRGDVSAVNYGANPYTDIAARSGEVLRDLEHLPEGARQEAMARLGRSLEEVERDLIVRDAPARDTARMSWRTKPLGVDPGGSGITRRLQARVATTAQRLVGYATANDLTPAELPMVALPWFEVRDAVTEPDTGRTATDVLIYDEIGGSFGVDASAFAEQIAAIDADEIHLRINSPGGSVFDALAIHSSLLHHPATVRTYVDGIAASAASLVAMAGDEVVMMPGSQLMIHDASMMVDGNEGEALKAAGHLGRQSNNLAGLYAAKAGGTVGDWRALMLDETWMFGAEAVEFGLADTVWVAPDKGDDPREERMTRGFTLTHFRYAGRASAPDPRRFRAFVGDGETARPVRDALTEMAAAGLSPATDPSSTATEDQTQGRSIALIEAQLSLDDE